MFAPKSILVPTDFSGYSDKALKEAVDIAVQNKSKIYLLHVIDEIAQCSVDYCLDTAVVMQLEDQSRKFAEEKLQKEVAAIGASKDIEIVFDIKKGDAAEVIVAEQKDKGIDLIVIASHGKKGILTRLGSVSERVLREAKGPVMLVK
ncbi:MAG TPA: universal stress protein [Smithellaceae bacterium]|jgi:nucleotide-binding universal stress UspA family protein|nr:universal stress protein [Smithellaceae bacterium]